ncbi:MAG: acyltransferase [Gammaproteobacteria bacterium]|nr:acyltransferase [Gammaproteobacteria bacterium]
MRRCGQILLGTLMFVLLVGNTLLWAVAVYAAIGLKLLVPAGRWRDRASRLAAYFAQRWALINVWVGDRLLPTRWELRVAAQLRPDGQYLVVANHQSWNDIHALIKTFGSRAPFFKFFLKKELIWVPVLGPVWWGLDYPFMQRHSREQIQRNPALRGQDLETTRRACEKYARLPVAILNFVEGTRFTPEKRARQGSPYRHLLKPKAGGLAFTLSAMGERLSHLLDVTIVYPEGAKSLWAFLAGRVRRVIVEVRGLTIPGEFFHGDYESDPAFRRRFHQWLSDLWAAKDARIDALLARSESESDMARAA